MFIAQLHQDGEFLCYITFHLKLISDIVVVISFVDRDSKKCLSEINMFIREKKLPWVLVSYLVVFMTEGVFRIPCIVK